jgi:hypothetical protein
VKAQAAKKAMLRDRIEGKRFLFIRRKPRVVLVYNG